MDYQILKQKKQELELEIEEGNFQDKGYITPEDYEKLLYYLAEYSDLTRQMLQAIKQKENIPVRDSEWNDVEDGKWIQHYLSLGE